MRVSGQLQTPAALPLEKEAWMRIEQETGGFHSRSEGFREEIHFFAPAGI